MVYKLSTEKQNIKMDTRSYFRSASKSSVVSSSCDYEDGNESEIDVQPIPPKKHCSVLLLNHLPSQDLESGDTMWEETFPWLECDLQGVFCKLCKKGGRYLQKMGGALIMKVMS